MLILDPTDLSSEVDDIENDWAHDQATGVDHGLLAEVIGKPEYTLLLGIQWVQESEQPKDDPAITAATATHTHVNAWRRNEKNIIAPGTCERASYLD